jgi:hypothetical protein
MKVPENAKIINFPGSILWFDEEGIACSYAKKMETPFSFDETVKTVEAFKKLLGGKKVSIILDISESAPSDKKTRDYMALEMPIFTKSLALVSLSPLGRMMANLFFGLKPPPYPAKIFSTEEEAREWIKTLK